MERSKNLRFAVIGTGFWANYQIAAWKELEGVEIVAVYNRTRPKAEAIATKFGIRAVYDNIDALLYTERLDFVDIITDVDTHQQFTKAAAARSIGVICQKPMAPRFGAAEDMLHTCHQYNVPFFIHENWRWQTPIRKVKSLLEAGTIGKVFKGKVSFCSGFPVFENQPFLAALDQFIITDIGSHILDVCRFLFGEVESLYCNTSRINPGINGEDVATVLMRMKTGASCFAEMSYASRPEKEIFPQTLIDVEGNEGSLRLLADYEIRITTSGGTQSIDAAPPKFPWADPAYALVHSSIVACNRNILEALKGNGNAETSGADNLETVRLVHAAYASARENKVIHLAQFP